MQIRPSEELAEVVRALYAAMGSGHPDAVEAFYSLSPHAVFLGTDRAEYWTDSAQHNLDVRPYWQRAGNTVTPGELLAALTRTPWWGLPARRLGRCTLDLWRPASWSWMSLGER